MPAMRALLIDLDGVLRRWESDNARLAESVGRLLAGAIQRAAFDPALLGPAITGRVPDHEWRRRVVARLNLTYSEADAQRAVELWSASVGALDERIVSLVRRVRSRARVVLVTNATSRLAADLVRLGLAGAFDAVVNSSEVGAAKPDAAIFHAALQVAGVTPQAATLVDDSATHVAAAEILGIVGHTYRDAAALTAHLCRYGLLAPSGGDEDLQGASRLLDAATD